MTLLHARGFPTFTHTNAEPDAAVSILEKLARRFPQGPVLHHRLEHIILTSELARRLNAVGGRFSIIAKRREGAKAYPDGQRPAPLRTYVEEDMRPVLVSVQCDGPALMEPIYGVAAACNTADDGGTAQPGQTVGFEDGLRMFTLWAAQSTHEDHDRGSIAVGKLGDFAVLSGDPSRLSGTQLFDLRVQATILGGTVVYGV
jgi:predicted amidohydrolase YtcJ